MNQFPFNGRSTFILKYRDEDPHSHFCSYLPAIDCTTKRILVGHHIKADKWICNGGHLDMGEQPLETAVREAKEELNLTISPSDVLGPFLINDIPITTSKSPCKWHYHVWFAIPTTESRIDFSFHGLKKEYYENRWVTIKEAMKLPTDYANLEAFPLIEKLYFQ